MMQRFDVVASVPWRKQAFSITAGAGLKRSVQRIAAFVVFATSLGQGQQVVAQQGAFTFRPTQDEYVVQAGDTLWDISERIVGSPWVWPRVWSYNPEISNPNWIYPGDVIRFYPTEQPLPRLQLIADSRPLPDDDPGDVVISGPDSDGRGSSIEEVSTAAPQRRKRRVFVGEFVTEKELQESGVLTNAADDKILLSLSDEVFLRFPKGVVRQVGEKYVIYRTARGVRHPITGARWGYLTQITGLATIVANEDERVSRARIVAAHMEIERGQYLTPHRHNPYVELEPPVPAERDVHGVILAVSGQMPRNMGEDDLVFIDKGARDGLMVGNRLQVLDTSDPLGKKYEPIPGVDIAVLQVLQTKEDAATCLVVDARRELTPGHWVRTIVH